MIFPELDAALNKILVNAGYSSKEDVLHEFSEDGVKFLKLPAFGVNRHKQLTALAIIYGYMVRSPDGWAAIPRSRASKEITSVNEKIAELEIYKKQLESLLSS